MHFTPVSNILGRNEKFVPLDGKKQWNYINPLALMAIQKGLCQYKEQRVSTFQG